VAPFAQNGSSVFSAIASAADRSSSSVLTRVARRILRGLLLLPVFGVALLKYGLMGTGWDPAQKAEWLSKLCSRVLTILGVQIVVSGPPPKSGLLVANHLSYLDILIISSLYPTVFVAKAEVRHWPLFGFLAAAAGCIFVDRQRRADVARVGTALQVPLEAGVPVCIFPEGTSSNGETVLPFYPSLLESAASGAYPVVPAGLDYFLAADDPREKVCFWGDMDLAPHLFELMGQPWVLGVIQFGSARQKPASRKTLALELREEVAGLRAKKIGSSGVTVFEPATE
jgi:1-acyl-sn-glycerol-3-phosphate acyltransferase